jgi:dTDP-4-dehydrorhamnose 3,5-epimerase
VSLRFRETTIEGVVVVEMDPIRDERGFFARAWCRDEFMAAGQPIDWVQVNVAHSVSAGTLRGVHLQRAPFGEHKLVRCTRGRLQDVAVDLRPDSPTYRRWVSVELTHGNGLMLLIPPGCAHGALSLEPETDFEYHTSRSYTPAAATGVRYDDPALAIEWQAPVQVVSAADRSWPLLGDRQDTF